MKKRFSQDTFLPQIQRSPPQKALKASTTYERCTSQLAVLKYQKANRISKLLRQVRNSMQISLSDQKSLEKQVQKKQQRKKKKENFLNNKQKKIYYYETTPTNQNEIILPRQTMKRLSCMIPQSVHVHEIQSMQKPPHRSKTAMCIEGDKLYLYGGIGCQPNLKLAVFDLDTKRWAFPQDEKFAQYHPTTPITGHSFTCYKGKGFIYGGKSTDIVNQLSIVNLKDFKFTQGQRCSYRRKDHAVTMISKFMVVQGGIQSNQTSNSMYFYNTETNTWTYPVVSQTLPYLSNHSISCAFPFKTKKKQINTLSELLDPIFMFGGKDKKGDLSNCLYKVSVQNETFVSEKIRINGSMWPQKRMQMTFQSVGNGYFMLYGGKKSDIQAYEEGNEIVSSVYSLNIEKMEWTKLSTSQDLPDRYGMASTAAFGKIYIFGGFINSMYANGDITVLTPWNPDVLKSKSNFGTRTVLSKQQCF